MRVRINRVYTRSGDTGETGLVGGERVRKSSLRVAAYGDVDELNSYLGLLKEKLTPQTADLRTTLECIQQELFDLGSQLATRGNYEGMWQVDARHVEALEQLCDSYGAGLPELRSFVLPGGTELAALLHIARCVCRRAERTAVALSEIEDLSPVAIHYLNRLSDLLFVLARWSLRAEGVEAPLWVKG